jgi:hypothetical protein
VGASTIGERSLHSRGKRIRVVSFVGLFDMSDVLRKAFELQVASGGVWNSILTTAGNNLNTTKYLGPAVSGHVLRIRMIRVVANRVFNRSL